MRTARIFSLILLTILAGTMNAQETEFKRPAPEIEAMAMSSPLPNTYFSNDGKMAVIGYRACKSIPIAKLAASEARIGGVRINTSNFSETRENYAERLEILNVATGVASKVEGIPQGEIKFVKWSPSGRFFCFTVASDTRVDLWRADVAASEPKVEKISKYPVNTIFGDPYFFLDDETILYKAVPSDLGKMPEKGMSNWPVVSENLGEKKSIRTYQDLLKSPYDADLYEWCCTTIPVVVDASGTRMIGEKAIYRSLDPSPDGTYIIAVTEHRPFSYIQGHSSFPSKRFIMSSADGSVVKMLKDGTVKEPKSEKPAFRDTADKDKKPEMPKKPKPENFSWRPDMPATLVWNENEGNGPGFGPMGPRPADDAEEEKDKPEKTFTQKLYQCAAPFDFENDKQLVLAPEYSMGPVTWCNDKLALFTESSRKQHFRRLMAFTPCDTAAPMKIIYTESTETDTLGNFPVYGRPYLVKNQYGRNVLGTDPKNGLFYLTGPNRLDVNGDKMSFIDKVTLKSGKIENAWMGAAPYREKVIAITDFSKLKFIETKEAFAVVPDYYEIDLKKKSSRQLTHFEDPAPMVKELMTRQFVTYTRKDGLHCSANLYLPAGYDPERDGRLPVFMWTYPYEYKCAAECEKDRTDRYAYVKPIYGSAFMWTSQGYAVLDGFTMAIVAADKDSEENDVFLDQLVMSAEAAVDFICDTLAIGDRERIGVGGHSYGGFMTANLLAHTRLFKAGIARSGAYNRSLTPFGFQNERRSYWKAKDVYDQMSPFNYADKIKDALLIIHGQMDNNTGTFPVQSERLYSAIVYNGGTARYLQMPYESHAYLGVETILHMLYETGDWLEKYLKY
jgi:Prolyl oligopeptidase family.